MVTQSSDCLVLQGRLDLEYRAQMQIQTKGGRLLREVDALEVRDATEATLLIAAATSFKNARDLTADPARRCETVLAKAAGKSYRQLRASHVADHQQLFRRVDLDLGSTDAARNPTDERLKAVRSGANDPQLAALYFQFGRYLLIGSSRPGSLPANLQGKWCQHYNAPWNSDYHFNINLQMNYWPAEVLQPGRVPPAAL